MFKACRAIGCFIGLALLTLLLGACGANAAKVDAVVVQLNQPHSALWCGFYAAEAQGYYADAGLDVTLLPGGDADPLAEVTAGTADFGISTAGELLLARDAGQPVRAIGAIMRRNPAIILSLAKTRMLNPAQLAQKRIGVLTADLSAVPDRQLWALLQHTAELEDAPVLVPVAEADRTPLSDGDVDALAYAWATDELALFQEDGKAVNAIYYMDYGILDYPNVIFARDDVLDMRSDMVERFVHATLVGYQYALQYPTESLPWVLAQDETLQSEQQLALLMALRPFVDVGDAPLGMMDGPVWQRIQELWVETGQLEMPVSPDSLYTNTFVTWAPVGVVPE